MSKQTFKIAKGMMYLPYISLSDLAKEAGKPIPINSKHIKQPKIVELISDEELKYLSPALLIKEYVQIKSSIKNLGITTPLIVNQQGVIVYDYISYTIAKEIEQDSGTKIHIPYEIKHFDTRYDMIQYTIKRTYSDKVYMMNEFRHCLYLDFHIWYYAEMLKEKMTEEKTYRYYSSQGLNKLPLPKEIEQKVGGRKLSYYEWSAWQFLTKEERIASEFLYKLSYATEKRIVKTRLKDILIFLDSKLRSDEDIVQILTATKKEIQGNWYWTTKYVPALTILQNKEVKVKELQHSDRVYKFISKILQQGIKKAEKHTKRKRVKIQSVNIEEFLDW